MTGRSWSTAASAAAFLALAGCGSHGGGGGTNPAPYPAPHPALPQVADQGGAVLSAPVITAITFPGDDYAPLIDDFTSRVGAASWWATVTTGYGIGLATATAPVHYDQPAPQTQTRAELEAWLASQVNGSNPAFPTPAPGSLYLVFPPDGSEVTDPVLGASCQGWYGFHFAFATTAGQVAYAVLPRCPAVADLSALDVLTADASHEIVEAATDPFQHDAWYGLDPAGEAFGEVAGGSEVADLCASEAYPYVETDDLPYLVARSWSNPAAAAGDRDPCQPTFQPWFGAAPELPDSFTIGTASTPVTGVKIAVGATRTITLDLFSEGPLGGDFQLSAYDSESRALGLVDPVLDLTFDRDHGVNGDQVRLKIHVRHAPTTLPGELVVLQATAGGALHRWPFWVANP